MYASKETLSSLYWLFCWICLHVSCRYWVINSWPLSLASLYSGCSAYCCTRSSIVCTRWSHNYAKPSTKIKSNQQVSKREGVSASFITRLCVQLELLYIWMNRSCLRPFGLISSASVASWNWFASKQTAILNSDSLSSIT